MPVSDDLFKKAMQAITTAEDSSGVKEEAGPDKNVGEKGDPTPGNIDPTSDQAAQTQLTPEEIEEFRAYKQNMTPGADKLPQEQQFSPFEHRQFSRLGLDPARLSFFQTLAGLRKGMGLESELLDRAMSGQRQEFSDVDELPLGKYS